MENLSPGIPIRKNATTRGRKEDLMENTPIAMPVVKNGRWKNKEASTMLKSISAKGLKGIDFDQALGKKTLILGPNGSGKSVMMIAINLLTLGFQPGVGKRPMDTMAKLASSDKMQICGQFEKVHLTRKFSTTKTGAKQEYAIDFKRSTADQMTVALSKISKVVDLSAFLDLSDEKRIEYMIGLGGDINELQVLDQQIDTLKESILKKENDLRSKERTMESLATSLNEIEMPAGTLTEVQAEISKVEAEKRLTRDNLEKARIEQAKKDAADAAEKTRKEAGAKQQQEPAKEQVDYHPPAPKSEPFDSNKLDQYGDPIKPPATSMQQEADGQITSLRHERENFAADIAKQDHLGAIVNNEAAQSIQRIIDAMDRGCNSICAAKLIAQKELRKYAGKEAA